MRTRFNIIVVLITIFSCLLIVGLSLSSGFYMKQSTSYVNDIPAVDIKTTSKAIPFVEVDSDYPKKLEQKKIQSDNTALNKKYGHMAYSEISLTNLNYSSNGEKL